MGVRHIPLTVNKIDLVGFDQGVSDAIVAFISSCRAERDAERRLPDGAFLAVFVDTALEACVATKSRGLYGRAIAGQTHNFTGISAPREAPLAPQIHLRMADSPADLLAEQGVATWARGMSEPPAG